MENSDSVKKTCSILGCNGTIFIFQKDRKIKCTAPKCNNEPAFTSKGNVKKIDGARCPKGKSFYIKCPICDATSCSLKDEPDDLDELFAEYKPDFSQPRL
ncbi:hypothetical protein GCM10011613_01080 [Cellvibrio zantedeschiae]|uniref:Uncharacterized protein n=1 Tax=Cellvibrio zantedeschiae TaxID=1237077 RepID=A0ABQ3AR50_9GAMM|nr:hypothetical protein GCM10011613_01080 [Cellvibrio zantedeschiae]